MAVDVHTREIVSERAVKAYAKLRPAWTRTDTMRWLNDRSAGVLAWLRRLDAVAAPSHSANMGRWLQAQRRDLFERAHGHLSADGLNEDRRAKLGVPEALG